ncbi:MAG TPA: cell division protein ZapE [Caulobacteraceae bacterium]|jgi:cell division protein ZapE|nr:cell division protein ZapE [Caulobacteraceae bacterium]
MSGLTRAAYDARLSAGEIVFDPAQGAALAALSRIEDELGRAGGGLMRRRRPVRGAYLFGPVGRGKSMLMDLFFAAAPVENKLRLHFYEFMARTHRLAAIWRSGDAAARRAEFGRVRGDDPIGPVADKLLCGARLVCFDELQVTDIADAMILGRLFEHMFDRGVTLVATSNRPPRDLYKDGLNRQLFVPSIDLIESRLEVVEVDGDRDWRLARLRRAGTWFAPDDEDNRRRFDALWASVRGGEAEHESVVEVLGRREAFARTAGGMVRATFDALCVHPRGPEDYLAIAAAFHTVFLEGLPRLKPERRNEARRLGMLIDALYEAKGRLVVLAQGEPASVYPAGDLSFEFQRAVSRLEEMRSAQWIAQGDRGSIEEVAGAA